MNKINNDQCNIINDQENASKNRISFSNFDQIDVLIDPKCSNHSKYSKSNKKVDKKSFISKDLNLLSSENRKLMSHESLDNLFDDWDKTFNLKNISISHHQSQNSADSGMLGSRDFRVFVESSLSSEARSRFTISSERDKKRSELRGESIPLSSREQISDRDSRKESFSMFKRLK